MIYKKHPLTVFMLNVGNHHVGYDSIPLLRHSLPDCNIVIWNNGSSDDHARRLESMSDVLINCTHNFGTSKGFGFAMLYLEYDWLVITAPDIMVRHDWFSLVKPLMGNPKVGVIGDTMKNEPIGTLRKCDKDSLPDGITLWRKEMIDQIGGVSPAFGLWGHDIHEVMRRGLDAGWEIYGVRTGLIHFGDGHTGVASVRAEIGDKEFDRLHSRSCEALNAKRENWWDSRLPEKVNG